MAKKPVHLVRNYHDTPQSKRKTLLWGSEKIDGVFAYFRKGQGYSRTGEEYCSWQHAADLCEDHHPDDVVIAEWVTFDDNWGMNPVNITSGHQRRYEVFEGNWMIFIHDIIPVADFDKGECLLPFCARINLSNASGIYDHPNVKFNTQTSLAGQQAHEEYATHIIEEGGEGAVFKDPDAPWIAGKKNEMQMKIKCGVSYDLECIGVEVGRTGTKYEGLFGKLVYRWTDGRTISARGRISEEQGAVYLASPPIGRIFQVDGMCLTPDGMIREPVTIMERVDKEVADV